MDIQSGAALEQRLHTSSFDGGSKERASGNSAPRAQGNTLGCFALPRLAVERTLMYHSIVDVDRATVAGAYVIFMRRGGPAPMIRC
jgi:hypothetical protein